MGILGQNDDEDGGSDVESDDVNVALDNESDPFGFRRMAGRIGAVRRFDSSVDFTSTPNKSNVSTVRSVLEYAAAVFHPMLTITQK